MGNDIEHNAAQDAQREYLEEGAAEAEAQADGFYGGYMIVDGEKWWSEGAILAAEDRARRAAQEERGAIVRWLREAVGSGPAEVIADQLTKGLHCGEGDPNG